MLVCVSCKTTMKVEKNGVGADFGNGHVYAGDRWSCPTCNRTILNCNSAPINDPNYTICSEYVNCEGGKTTNEIVNSLGSGGGITIDELDLSGGNSI